MSRKCMKPNWNFQWGGGVWGPFRRGYGYFLEPQIYIRDYKKCVLKVNANEIFPYQVILSWLPQTISQRLILFTCINVIFLSRSKMALLMISTKFLRIAVL